MARFIQEYRLTEAKDRNYLAVCHFLNQRGYTAQQYKGETVLCKGSAAIGNETMIKVSYPTGMIRLEVWMKTLPIPGIVDGELSVEGYYASALKGEMKSVIRELDKLLGGPGNRIGTHPFFLKKSPEESISSLFSSFQTPKTQTKNYSPPPPKVEEPRPAYQPTRQERKVPPIKKADPAPVQQAKPVQKPAATGIVDVNRCTQSELMTLPGMTVAQAKRAMEYRAEHGGFRSLDEFVDVLGIKPHFAVQIFSVATVSQQEAKPVQQHNATSSRRTIDF